MLRRVSENLYLKTHSQFGSSLTNTGTLIKKNTEIIIALIFLFKIKNVDDIHSFFNTLIFNGLGKNEKVNLNLQFFHPFLHL